MIHYPMGIVFDYLSENLFFSDFKNNRICVLYSTSFSTSNPTSTPTIEPSYSPNFLPTFNDNYNVI
jgi:hypothetical protein